tara:strand:- start:60 stop:590 length:531 start_codon:yes stop_codon:yes gene_type:complete
MIEIKKTLINDVKIFKPTLFSDSRGYFFESYNKNSLEDIISNISFIQDNESKSSFGVLRGIHFQKSPFEQSKLVRVVKGKIQDVVVDLRKNSNTYGKYISVILDDVNKEQIFIPKGCGHAFLTLSKEAIISYKVDNYYSKEHDSGIVYDDPKLNIKWELEKNKILTSEKDNDLPQL